MAFAKSSEECNGAIVSVLEGSVRDVDLLADYVNDHIHALTGVPLPVPPPVVPSSTTSETSFREPTPPPPPPDDTAWVDPTAAYYDKQLLQATEENILLRERLADLENVIRDGDDEEDKGTFGTHEGENKKVGGGGVQVLFWRAYHDQRAAATGTEGKAQPSPPPPFCSHLS